MEFDAPHSELPQKQNVQNAERRGFGKLCFGYETANNVRFGIRNKQRNVVIREIFQTGRAEFFGKAIYLYVE